MIFNILIHLNIFNIKIKHSKQENICLFIPINKVES